MLDNITPYDQLMILLAPPYLVLTDTIGALIQDWEMA